MSPLEIFFLKMLERSLFTPVHDEAMPMIDHRHTGVRHILCPDGNELL
jgi:hypothetical protein